jgi:hypothetical protein
LIEKLITGDDGSEYLIVHRATPLKPKPILKLATTFTDLSFESEFIPDEKPKRVQFIMDNKFLSPKAQGILNYQMFPDN